MLKLHTDLRLIENWPARLKSSFDWSVDPKLLVGEWVRVDADNEITRITADLTVPDAFQLWSHTGRGDIDVAETIATLRGFNYTATTDRWNKSNTSIVASSPLKVTGDTRTAEQGGEGGWLDLAATGDLIRAIALGIDGDEITFRFLEGWAKV